MEVDRGFGVPIRVFKAQSLDDPRDVISIGFVAVSVEALNEGLASVAAQEDVRHDRIGAVRKSKSLRCIYELHAEHDFTAAPVVIEPGSPDSLLSPLKG